MKVLAVITASFLITVNLLGQVPARTAPAIDVQLSNILAQLENASQSSNIALGKLRIDKWKTNGDTKDQYRDNVGSIQRNLSAALPELLSRVRQAPQDANANFKLYRNVNTLYDVLANVTETAGAFGPKDQYESLAQPLVILDQVRHDLADRLDQLTSAKEAELGRLRGQLQAVAQSQAAAPPKKIIIDDNEPAKPKKTKTTKKPSAVHNKTGDGTKTSPPQ